MNKATKVTYEGGMNKDITKSKHPPNFYFEGRNIRIVATDSQSTTSVTNEKGNKYVLTIPQVTVNSNNRRIEYFLEEELKTLTYSTQTSGDKPRCELEEQFGITNGNPIATSGNQRIIGDGLIRNHFIVFTTDNNGFDCIWKLNEKTFEFTLLYLRNMGFSKNNPIQVISNYENKKIDKIYWVDSKHQLRFLNTKHSIANGDLEELIDLPVTILNQVGDYTFSQPKIINTLSGGEHTSGMIQYVYNLYKINSSQTAISPFSELIPLNKGENGGGGVNEVVGTIPVVRIDNLDNNYTNLKLYSIKYTSFNEIPQISLIADVGIIDESSFTYYDDGNIINTVSLDELLFLESNVLIPNHIQSKDNRLFLSNYSEFNFDVNIDCRAYSFDSAGDSIIADGFINFNNNPVFPVNTRTLSTPTPTYNLIPETHSTINVDYDRYRFTTVNTVLGGEGEFIKYEITRNQLDNSKKHFKDREIYRIGIQFYNKKGQISLPKWIADFKCWVSGNESNLNGYYSGLKVTLKSAFYTWLNNNNNFLDINGVFNPDLKPVGYRILRANRLLKDKTIITQGLLNPMMSIKISNFQTSHYTGLNIGTVPSTIINEADTGLKTPSLMRRFDDFLCPMYGCDGYSKLNRGNGTLFTTPLHPNSKGTGKEKGDSKEYYRGTSKITNAYQYNQMMQLFSPEILFEKTNSVAGTRLNIIGGLVNNNNSFWGQERDINTQEILREGKVLNCISPHDIKAVDENLVSIEGNISNLVDYGYIAGTSANSGSDKNMVFNQLFRDYTGDYIPAVNNNTDYSFYGQPTIIEKGQGRTTYNNDSNFIFSNSWESLITDGGEIRPLKSVNSWGAKSIVFVLNDSEIDAKDRTRIEELQQTHLTQSNANETGLIAEIRIDKNLIYIGNIYGGNTYESKKRTNYIEIGEYSEIVNNELLIDNPGDIFISDFKFTKLSKTDTEVYSNTVSQFTEIVNFKVESTIDLKNRNDLSLSDWDNRFQPRYEEYQKYNRVYSQEGNLILRRDLNYNFKEVEDFDTNVISTKLKSGGELIDSWTEVLMNETLTLDGKYGPITGLANFKDNIFCFQDTAMAYLSINPRVQVTGSDGINVELGTGSVLQEYEYIDTTSGTQSKWSIVTSPNALYYYDNYNKAIKLFKGQNVKLSDLKGLHTYFINNIDFDNILEATLVNKNIATTYDNINNEVIFSFIGNKTPFTLTFNENMEAFTSFYDYIPYYWFSRGDILLAASPNDRELYQQYKGNYNEFFGEYHPSYITLMINPEADLDCVFDNIMYKSELYLDDIDQPNKTLSHIQAFNEYQNSGLIPLELGRNKNLRRKFRNWHALIPREGRNRIRNPWIYLKLQLTNEDNYKMILHDMVVYYTI